jgi:hypothetical protein
VATDDVDGTSSAVPSGAVDTSAPGAYIIAYDAVDNAGNRAVEVTRTVNVIVPTTPALPNTGSPGFPNTGITLPTKGPAPYFVAFLVLLLFGAAFLSSKLSTSSGRKSASTPTSDANEPVIVINDETTDEQVFK